MPSQNSIICCLDKNNNLINFIQGKYLQSIMYTCVLSILPCLFTMRLAHKYYNVLFFLSKMSHLSQMSIIYNVYTALSMCADALQNNFIYRQ